MQDMKRIQLLDYLVIDVFFSTCLGTFRPTEEEDSYCLIPAAGSLLRMMAHALARLHHLALLLLSVYLNTVSSQGKHLYDLFHPSSSITTANRSLFIHLG